MKVKFYLARPSAVQATAIFASVSYNGHRVKIYINETIDPKYWNAKTHSARITPRFTEGPEFNRRLENIRSAINKIYLNHKNDKGAAPEPAALKTLAEVELQLRKAETNESFKSYFESFIIRHKEGLRVGKRGAIKADSGKGYGTTLNTVIAFRPNTDFKDISLPWYNDFLSYLQKQNLSLNFIGIHIQRLKAVLAEAEASGYPVNPDYKSKYFAKLSEAADNIALSETELLAMAAYDLADNKRLEAVRDLFLIGCYTGLRYSDFSRLTAKHIREGFIYITQQKTGGEVVIPVHPVVAGIVERYGGKLPSAISNQKTNDYLKEVCRLVPELQVKETKSTTKGGKKITVAMERWQMISSHTARRSFPTMMYNKGIPSLTIMAITGHKTEKQFLRYIKVSPTEHAHKMKAIWATEAKQIMKAV